MIKLNLLFINCNGLEKSNYITVNKKVDLFLSVFQDFLNDLRAPLANKT